MSQRIYFDIDGRLGGPVTFIQLQLMASSGMLQPHHRVRKDDSDQWLSARSVKGLFSPAEVAAPPTPVPTAAPTSAAAPTEDENPFGAWGPPTEDEPPSTNSAFDFFSRPPAPPAAAPPPAPSVRKPARTDAAPAPAPAPSPAPSTRKPAEPVPPAAPPGNENPFEFGPDAGPSPPGTVFDLDQPMAALPVEAADAVPVQPPAPPPPPPAPAPIGKKPSRSDEARADVKAEPAAVSQAVEVTGQAVELLPEASARLLDGKTVFRLSRAWLLATTRFTDGTSRIVYLRPDRIDAGIYEQRRTARHTKGGPLAVLAFSAGAVEVALAFQGSDKPFRAFLERVMSMGGGRHVAK